MNIEDKYIVRSCDTEQTKEWFLKKHYAHRIPNSIYTFGLYEINILVGVISFGMSANNNLNEIISGYESIELNRLIINDGLPKNILSYFVGRSLRLIPKPKIIISYADTSQKHHGYIYQATNFIYTGLGKEDYEFIKNNRQFHRKNLFDIYGTGSLENAKLHGYEIIKVSPKHRYVYLLGNRQQVRDMKKKLPFKQLPYPKGDNLRYDSSYKINSQISLF